MDSFEFWYASRCFLALQKMFLMFLDICYGFGVIQEIPNISNVRAGANCENNKSKKFNRTTIFIFSKENKWKHWLSFI